MLIRSVDSVKPVIQPAPSDSLGSSLMLGVVAAAFHVTTITLDWGEVVVDYLVEREMQPA